MHLLKYILIQHILVVCLQNERWRCFCDNIDVCEIKVWWLCVSCDVRFYTKKNKKYNSYVLMDIGSYIHHNLRGMI